MDSINFDSLDNEGGGRLPSENTKLSRRQGIFILDHSMPSPIISDCAAIIKKGIDCHLFDPSITIYCLLITSKFATSQLTPLNRVFSAINHF